jgi:hypothetical protein
VTLFFFFCNQRTQGDLATAQLKNGETKMKEREIAVRGFINEKFGSTYGKGLFHRAIYNGSVEVRNPYAKYLIDLFEFGRWDITARSPEQLGWSKKLHQADVHNAPEALASWIQHYDPVTKVKTLADGVCVYLPLTQELYVSINDPAHGVSDEWTLLTKNCTKTGVNKPVFIATNVDLSLTN